MHLTREHTHHFAIEAYDTTSVRVGGTVYRHNILILPDGCSPWEIDSLNTISASALSRITMLRPEIMIFTHPTERPASDLIVQLYQAGIGVESMPLGAACRTFNILLGEGRRVGLGIVF